MKRKLLEKKSVKTLKSLHKNAVQRYDGIVKNIEKKEKTLQQVVEDIEKIEEIILDKEMQ